MNDRPLRDAENEPATAFSLDDVHGYQELFRRASWTVVVVLVVVAICLGLFFAWRAGR